jgi:hypothetical protein
MIQGDAGAPARKSAPSIATEHRADAVVADRLQRRESGGLDELADPASLRVLANLPSNIEGEESVGIAMMTLTEVDGKTLVSNFMARHYDWTGDGPNPLRDRRASDEFRESNRAAWEGQLLPRLRELVEGAPQSE